MERGYRPRAKLLRTEFYTYTCIEIRARFSLSKVILLVTI